jgi:hypothetical protein
LTTFSTCFGTRNKNKHFYITFLFFALYTFKEVVVMMEDAVLRITLAVVIGTLAAIVYSLRVLVLMERRMAKIEMHIDRVTQKILKEEIKIERMIKRRTVKKKK